MVPKPSREREADEWAKLAAEELDSHWVEWLRFVRDRRTQALRSLANLKREFAEVKWKEAKGWLYSRINRNGGNPMDVRTREFQTLIGLVGPTLEYSV